MSFLYSILPEYTKNIDSLKEYSIHGEYQTLEGFTEAIDESVFSIISSSIKEVMSFNDVFNISEKYMPYFSFLLGYKWNDYIDSNMQRHILANILELYKRKGSKFSFHYSLYPIDPNVNMYEPYRDIFYLNKSKLNSRSYLPSKNYYSYGIIVISMNNVIPEIYEVIEGIRPAGWKFIIERKLQSITDMNFKPKEEPRLKSITKVFTKENIEDDYQYQLENSIQYSKEKMIPITMYGNRTTTFDNLLTLKHLDFNSIYVPNEKQGYNTFLRYGVVPSKRRAHWYVWLKHKLDVFAGTIFTRYNEYNYTDLVNYFSNRIENESSYQKIEYNNSNLNAHLLANSIHYSQTLIDSFRKIDFNKVSTLSREEFTLNDFSCGMQKTLNFLKYFTINSVAHVLAEDIKQDRQESYLEGYTLTRYSSHHFSRKLKE